MLGMFKQWLGRGTAAPMPAPAANIAPVWKREIDAGGFNHAVFSNVDGVFRDATDAITDNRAMVAARVLRAIYDSDLGGAVDVALGQIIGTGLRPNVAPAAELIGWDDEKANAWARRVERLFELWACSPADCDVAGRRTFAEQQRAAGRSLFGVGEILATFPAGRAPGAMFASPVNVMDVQRIDESSSTILNGAGRSNGLEWENGRPIGVVIKDRDEASGLEDWQSRTVPFRSKSGKPLAELIFDAVTPAQQRGISVLLQALRPHLQYSKLSDAHLAAAILQSSIAGVVTSSAASEEVMQALSSEDMDNSALNSYIANKSAYHKAKTGGLNAVGGLSSVVHLLPDETFDFKGTEIEADNLSEFARLLKLEIARALGIGYSLATGDYTGATYSSVRMETACNWPLVLGRRAIIARFCQAAFEHWLENAILAGMIDVPGGYERFVSMRAAFTRCHWRGPAMPQADEGKSANAAKTRLEIGTTSLADECAASGTDWQTVLEQRAREKAYAAKLGLPDPHLPDGGPQPRPAEPEEHGGDIEDEGERLEFDAALERLDMLKTQLDKPAAFNRYGLSGGHVGTRVLDVTETNMARRAHNQRIARLEAAIAAYQGA
jgi:lambda family phage portal protein